MPRLRRHVRPGALIHIVVRFVNHEYLLDSPDERDAYLRLASHAFRRSDWQALSFALMSTHTHFAAIAGRNTFDSLSRPWHVGFVGWINPRRARLGGAIANRPATHEVATSSCARLIAYHHNNPVRAGVVSSANKSTWTSHRYYRGDEHCDWLDVEQGLELAGYGSTTVGRERFARFVESNEDDNFSISDASLCMTRRRARSQLGPIVELGHARCDDETALSLWTPDGAKARKRWPGSLQRIAHAVASHCKIDSSALASASRMRVVAGARRIFILVAREHAGRSLTEAAAFVTISIQAASKLVCNTTREQQETARTIALLLGIVDSTS